MTYTLTETTGSLLFRVPIPKALCENNCALRGGIFEGLVVAEVFTLDTSTHGTLVSNRCYRSCSCTLLIRDHFVTGNTI